MSDKPAAKQPVTLKPVEPGRQLKSKGVPWNDPEFSSNFPTLTAYMTQETYPSGQRRALATLTLFMDNQCLTLVMNDRENQRSCFISEASLFSCLLKLENDLCDDCADWRSAKQKPSMKNDTPF